MSQAKSIWLTYHDVYHVEPLLGVPRYAAMYHVSKHAFTRHLSTILSLGRRLMTVSDFLKDNTKDAVILTFDDGWRGAFEIALPILQAFDLKATFFITRAFVGREGFCDHELILRAARAGMEIGVHGTTHRMLSACTREEMVWEFAACKAFLESLLQKQVQSASMPGGDWNPKIASCAKEAGLTSLCTSKPGINNARVSPFNLRRVSIRRTTADLDVQRYCRYQIQREWLRWVALQAPCRLLGKRNYSRVRQWLLDTQKSRGDDLFTP
jgi:peptidoglycan/xylan/chitin deacetylase (PgdA/CDA1 family)